MLWVWETWEMKNCKGWRLRVSLAAGVSSGMAGGEAALRRAGKPQDAIEGGGGSFAFTNRKNRL